MLPLLPGFGESLPLLWPLFLEQGQGEQGASSQHCILRSQQKLGSEGKERLGSPVVCMRLGLGPSHAEHPTVTHLHLLKQNFHSPVPFLTTFLTRS